MMIHHHHSAPIPPPTPTNDQQQATSAHHPRTPPSGGSRRMIHPVYVMDDLRRELYDMVSRLRMHMCWGHRCTICAHVLQTHDMRSTSWSRSMRMGARRLLACTSGYTSDVRDTPAGMSRCLLLRCSSPELMSKWPQTYPHACEHIAEWMQGLNCVKDEDEDGECKTR